jgi:alpha 1,2-mannosyltransferase
MKRHPEYVAEGNSMGFISDNGGEEYNLCHCKPPSFTLPAATPLMSVGSQSGQISKLRIWTSGVPRLTPLTLTTWKLRVVSTTRFASLRYPHLRTLTRCVFHKRWGDAPVHSIGAALFARKDQIHFFDEIGYEHAPYQHCPREKKSWENGRCGCNPSRSFGASNEAFP